MSCRKKKLYQLAVFQTPRLGPDLGGQQGTSRPGSAGHVHASRDYGWIGMTAVELNSG